MSIDWEFNLDFGPLNAAMDAAVPIAVGRAAEHIRGEAVQLAPIESGHLRASAEVVVVDHNEAHVKFPGPYARYQHYGLDFRHPRGGQALYLEQPMNTETQKVTDIMGDTLREAMG